jgi:thioredoxin reductase (NADPH)
MAKTIIVGDGPGGLSAALFLAKSGEEVAVFGTDETAMHHAFLRNYLGVPETAGSDFQTIARRQAAGFGAELRQERVATVAAGFVVTTEDGAQHHADYLVLTEGKNPVLARSLGAAEDEDGIIADRNGMSSIDRIYVIGRAARPRRSQAIISAGAGAVAALDILAREQGRDVQDWDTPPKEGD